MLNSRESDLRQPFHTNLDRSPPRANIISNETANNIESNGWPR